MPKRGDAIEMMCQSYWNAYRDGMCALGVTDYPTWDSFTEAKAKAEVRRCMRHAVDALLTLPASVYGNAKNAKMEKGAYEALHARMFPDKPTTRKALERSHAEAQAEAMNAAAK